MKNLKERVEKIIKGRNFEELVEILKEIPGDIAGAMIRENIMAVMEEKYPEKFYDWMEQY